MTAVLFRAFLITIVFLSWFLLFSVPARAANIVVSDTAERIVSPIEFVFQTGTQYGYVPVIYSESMVTPPSATIRAGQGVSVIAAFNSARQLVATGVTVTPQTQVRVTGTITRIISPNEFICKIGARHGKVTVLSTGSLIFPRGSTITVGQTVSVTGNYNVYSQFAATSIAIFSLYHISTWARDFLHTEGQSASAASVTQLVSYAEGDAKALADCHSSYPGCKAVFYLDYAHSYNDQSGCIKHPDADVVAAASEDWFVHDAGYSDSAHRVHGVRNTTLYNGCYIWEMNPNSPGLQRWWRNYLQTNADAYDMYFLDNDDMEVVLSGYFEKAGGGGCDPWPHLCYTTQEIPNDAAEANARANFANAMSHRDGSPMYSLYQQFSFNYPLDVGDFTASSQLIGATCEGCVASTKLIVRPNLYAPVLKEMATINASPGSYLLISQGNSSAGSANQILQRLVTTGIIWLAYSEGHTIVQPDLEANTNNLAIWPEDLIYPSDALQSMALGPNDLQVAPGVYRREFAKCYQKAILFGPCAAVVNAAGSSVYLQSSWFAQSYHHVITLRGGDVLSGGTANVVGATFVPGATSLQAGAAALLAP
jgi:hypothetical protein